MRSFTTFTAQLFSFLYGCAAPSNIQLHKQLAAQTLLDNRDIPKKSSFSAMQVLLLRSLGGCFS